MKEIWLTPKELAGKFNFPKTVQGVAYRAKSENWKKRKVLGQKGGGYEYEVSTIINKNHIKEPSPTYEQSSFIKNNAIVDPNYISLKFDSSKYTLVPELNINVAAGYGAYPLNEEQIGQFVFSKYWLAKEGLANAKLAIMHVVGDSMETTINDGDIVLVNVKDEGWTGALDGVFVILFNDMLLVKRLQFDMMENGFHIISDNPTYKPYFIKFDNGITFKVLAKVERVLTRMRQSRQI